MTDKVYRGAIVGLGYIGGADQVSGDALGQLVQDLDGTHFSAMRNHPRVKLVAGSSRDAGRRERFTERSSVPTYANWREMLEREQLDIVSVATYTPQHAEITVACAQRGVRAIYCEKPIASTVSEAEQMLAACKQAGSLLAVNHNRRFNLNFRRLRDLVAAGQLGELTSASVQWGSGRLGNVGTHMFNALCMLTDRRVEAVSATLDLAGRPDCRGAQFHDPGGWGVLRLEGGLMTVFDAADYGVIPGAIALNGTQGRAIAGAGDVSLDFWDGTHDHWPAAAERESSMDRAMGEIIVWLDGDAAFPDSPENSLHTLEVIAGCHASHRRHAAWTPIPLQDDERELEVGSG